MKRAVYLAGFTILGILFQFLVHSGIEIWYIGLLVKDFPRYGLGLAWTTWIMIHHIGSILLFAGGAYLGYRQGNFWWRKIYEEHAIRKQILGF